MATQLKSLLNTVCAELNIGQQTSFVGSSVADAVQLLALANAAGTELMQKFAWQALQTEYRFTYNFQQSTTAVVTAGSSTITNLSPADVAALQTSAVTGQPLVPAQWWVGAPSGSNGVPQDTYLTAINAGAFTATMSQAASSSSSAGTLTFSQTRYPLPADFDRVIDRTQWDKSKHWEMMGPSSPQQRQWLKSGYISTGPRIRWWLQGGYMQLWPALSASEYLGYEYVSNLWALSAASAQQAGFLADTDTSIYKDRLLISLIKFKYATAKGWKTDTYAQELSNLFSLCTSEELGAPILSLSPRLTNVLVGINNIPDSGYGQ